MSRNIDSEQQLTLYDSIVTVLRNNSTLGARFGTSNFYEFEPSIMSINFSQVPYISVSIPTLDTEIVSLNRKLKFKSISIPIRLVIDFTARSKFRTYANALINQLEISESTFEQKGYYDLVIDLESVGEEMINQKKVIAGNFVLSFNGTVSR